MNLRAFMAAGVMLAGLSASGASLGRPSDATRALFSKGSGELFQNVSCNKNDDDKQAQCMEHCDEAWIKATQAYNSNIDKARGEKKACEAKCGC